MPQRKGFRHSEESKRKIGETLLKRNGTQIINGEKRCTHCNKHLSLDKFAKTYEKIPSHSQVRSTCRFCDNSAARARKHRLGQQRPLYQVKESPSYLGVYIAEQVLSKYFEDIQVAPYGNRGFDFICKNGYKIDVKSSCQIQRSDGPRYWKFMIKKNKIADFFLCLAFDNRIDLNPLHIWLVPSERVNNQYAFHVFNSERSLKRWIEFEHSIDKVKAGCRAFRKEGK